MKRAAAVIISLIGLVSPSYGALSVDVIHIADDPRCQAAANIADDEAALASGCFRFWEKHPSPTAPDRQVAEARNRRLAMAWYSAQAQSRGHYASQSAPPSTARALATTTPPATVASSGPDPIRAKCAQEWHDDFQMRAFCEQKQRESAQQLQRRSMESGDRATIRAKCARDWPQDFQMRDFCEEQQLKALDALR